MNLAQITTLLKKQGQSHLLRYYNELDAEQQSKLLSQIEQINFEALRNPQQEGAKKPLNITPIQILSINEIANNTKHFHTLGIDALRKGKIAAVLLAGGQGTRLGHDSPKGTFDLGITRELSLYQVLADTIRTVAEQVKTDILFYIMTSDKTYEKTIHFFAERDYFGYKKDCIRFFKQDMMVSVDFDGKILMASKFELSLSPNGNGGWFTSLQKAGFLEEIKANGVEWLNVFSVDNPLQKICDPVFIGATMHHGCDCAAKVVRKTSPEEKVGVMCLEDGKPYIVEYMELLPEMRQLKNDKGNYLFFYGVILNYLFRLHKMCLRLDTRLPLHKSSKKIPCIDESGNPILPEVDNGYKYETFILDWIHLMDSCLPYEVERSREFAPVKSDTGEDTPEVAQSLMQKNGMVL